MSTDYSKLCADFIRESYRIAFGGKLKATHARELVAALFGYKSHAALLAEKKHPLSRLDETTILVPAIELMAERRVCLKGLPGDLPSSFELAKSLCDFLKENDHYTGEVWLYETLEGYICEQFLIEHDGIVMDELSGVMAETNANFDDPYYEAADINEGEDDVVIEIKGTYSGNSDQDKPFCGNQIDMSVTVTLFRSAGRAGFWGSEISAGGAVNDDWVDPELHYERPVAP